MAEIVQSLNAARRNLQSEWLADRMRYWELELTYLDTFAYLRLFAGDPKLALRDLNRCVALCECLMQLYSSMASDRLQLAGVGDLDEQLKLHYAVILHHRGDALLRPDNKAAAHRDIARAGELGYSRQLGRW